MGMHATKDRVESETSTVYSISLYESTITTRDEPWFGELKFALGVKKKDSQLLRAIVYWGAPRRLLERREPGLHSERWRVQTKVKIGGLKIPHLIGGGKRIDISMWYSLFYFSWERTAKSIRTVQWRIRGEQSANGARSACERGTEKKKKCGG
jgi:hypothetical protein